MQPGQKDAQHPPPLEQTGWLQKHTTMAERYPGSQSSLVVRLRTPPPLRQASLVSVLWMLS